MIEIVKELVSDFCDLPPVAPVINWASPVPAFGNPYIAQVATLGLNPSDREFLDPKGGELSGTRRRFPTLNSLGIQSWQEATDAQIEEIVEACRYYFERNPYKAWFDRLDFLIQATNTSYYLPENHACHLDLVPYATNPKWGSLRNQDKTHLLVAVRNVLGKILRDAPIRLLILNGRSVVSNFSSLCHTELLVKEESEWCLHQKSHQVKGYSFIGVVNRFGEIDLSREILILGFNHNIQSSIGMTRRVRESIRKWIGVQWQAYHEV